ncbi:MAG: AEC family transporter [Anaerolineae bacterium]|nr:AEC family transporter [Anaerolineae bacterium]
MADVLNTILQVISPIFLIIGAAALIGRRFHPDESAISVLMVYLFTPALVFRGFATMELSGAELGGIAGVALGVSLVMAVLGVLLTRWLKWERALSGSFIASIIMINAANYGIPLNTFAFGAAGAERAVAYYALALIPGNILGIYFTSRGSFTARQALLNVLTVPITYAALAGLAVNYRLVTLPEPVMRAITDIAASAAIPLMLAMLGFRLAHATVRGSLQPILLATLIRLVLAPLIALPLALLFGLSGVTLKVAIVQSSMPTAVLVNVLAAQFGSDTEFASTVTVVSTLASILTLSVLITLLTQAVPV